jgi:hypothetical protein
LELNAGQHGSPFPRALAEAQSTQRRVFHTGRRPQRCLPPPQQSRTCSAIHRSGQITSTAAWKPFTILTPHPPRCGRTGAPHTGPRRVACLLVWMSFIATCLGCKTLRIVVPALTGMARAYTCMALRTFHAILLAGWASNQAGRWGEAGSYSAWDCTTDAIQSS